MYTLAGGVSCFLLKFEFHIAILGIGRGHIRLVSPLRFKTSDSYPEKSNMGPVSIDFREFCDFQKSGHGFLTQYLSCFRLNRPKVGFSSFLVATKKMRDKKLHRFVVVSPREVPSL